MQSLGTAMAANLPPPHDERPIPRTKQGEMIKHLRVRGRQQQTFVVTFSNRRKRIEHHFHSL